MYFGLEIFRWFGSVNGDYSNVAHMAHLGGFLAAYLMLPAVAKGGPFELGVEDGGPSGNRFQEPWKDKGADDRPFKIGRPMDSNRS